ncbi:MAG: oligoendopeptidase, M3 family [Bacteroidetes bacterium]|nr:MAG: oligoendopeptidase, M3 family [Bacteroidota bacterium]
MNSEVEIPARATRRFLPVNFVIESWENIEPWLQKLEEREIRSVEVLESWIRDTNELSAVIGEESGWRFIRMTCDTSNEAYDKAYNFFVEEVEPKLAPYYDRLNRKLAGSPFLSALPGGKYDIYIRSVKQDIAIYREENIPLFTEIDKWKQQYTKLVSDMMVEIDGKELTMSQAANLLKNTDREIRKTVFEKISVRRLKDQETLDKQFDELCRLRQEVAVHAGFANFRDYMFAALGRFDYTPADCFAFHKAIAQEVIPVVNEIDAERKKTLGLDVLRPYDTEVDENGRSPLRPFETAEELVEKTITCLQRLNPVFAEYIAVMRRMGRFDIDSRKGKAPGGYNYPLHESGVPFIFMNAASAHRDVVTMVHEAGHAVHSFLMRDLEIKAFRDNPSEVDELASMSMELMTMEHWDVFYPDPADLKRARAEHLEKIIDSLCWIAAVDKFQHWIYEHKQHTAGERAEAWHKIMGELGSGVTDWSGYEDRLQTLWQRQLHIYEMPFYYIEYGFAQLGAIAVWRNYKNDPAKAVAAYEKALRMGYTRPIGEIYAAAGVRFDFSGDYVNELIRFVRKELHDNKS